MRDDDDEDDGDIEISFTYKKVLGERENIDIIVFKVKYGLCPCKHPSE